MDLFTHLHSLSDDQLLLRLSELLRQSRRTEADLVAHIGEVDERRLYAREASPSMFAYCTEVLHLSEHEAYLRIAVARAARRHPVLLTMLREGGLHLSGIAKLAPQLTEANRDAVLARAVHRSRREIEELVAELLPRPDVAGRIRKLPGGAGGMGVRPAGQSSGGPMPGLFGPGDDEGTRAHKSPAGGVSRGEGRTSGLDRDEQGRDEALHPAESSAEKGSTARDLRAGGEEAGAGDLRRLGPDRVARGETGASRARVEPLSPGRYRVQFTASRELRDKLERLRSLMRPSVPDGDLAAIIDAAVTEKLQKIEAKRFAKTQKRGPKGGARIEPRAAQAGARDDACGTRHVLAEVRRAVFTRDGGQCRYVGRSGRRCSERVQVEYHHGHPYALRGGRGVGNIGLLCRAHNRLMAEVDYGKKAMGRFGRATASGGVRPGSP